MLAGECSNVKTLLPMNFSMLFVNGVADANGLFIGPISSITFATLVPFSSQSICPSTNLPDS